MPSNSARSRPALLGTGVGVLLAVALATFIPAAELQPGDSRLVVGVVGGLVLVPASLATAYLARLASHHLRREPRLRLAWPLMALFFTVAFAASALSDGMAARRYGREGRQAQGTVVAIHPENHDTLLVGYTAGGVAYRCRAAGPRPARTYKLGEAIPVYYVASAPQTAWLQEPSWQPGLLLAGWVLSAGVLPVWLVGLAGALLASRHAPDT